MCFSLEMKDVLTLLCVRETFGKSIVYAAVGAVCLHGKRCFTIAAGENSRPYLSSARYAVGLDLRCLCGGNRRERSKAVKHHVIYFCFHLEKF